jgi:PBSX family phage terminase large subunit
VTLKAFSPKQKRIFTWWRDAFHDEYDGIICDGAVRSGKTVCMSLSFIMWGQTHFNNASFAICGKTIASVKRNIICSLTSLAKECGFEVRETLSKNYLDISVGDISNRYYIFGGKDESSAALIQGMTLSGVLFDETALMPRSFVEQAIARCSVNGSKIWFNCNPEGSGHWFKREWIDKATEKHLLYLHFELDDNPSLSERVKERYRRLYSGSFYERFILGRWTDTSGLIYPMFTVSKHVVKTLPENFERYIVSCDYGTVNPSSFGLWGLSHGIWYRISEYYYDSRREGIQRTDEEHYRGLEQLCCGRKIDKIICDPSAASFIACIRSHGKFNVTQAKNDVLSGIRRVGDMLNSGKLKISANCTDCIREFELYRWDNSAVADRPLKENDHAMDDLRYFVAEVFKTSDSFFVMSLER